MSLYALNLFDLADNDGYLADSKRSVAAVGKYGGKVVALGRLDAAASPEPGRTPPRQVMVRVEWPDRAAFETFQRDPEHHDLHPLRQNGTKNYLWWTYERLEDLRPVLKRSRTSGT